MTFHSQTLQNYTVSDGVRRIDFEFSLPTTITSNKTRRLLDRKSETNEILAGSGVRVPRSVLIDRSTVSVEQVAEYADRIGYPVVLKPNVGSTGKGVFANIPDRTELLATYVHLVATLNPRRILLEEHIHGNDYRILVVGREVVGAVHRVPAHVIGDGVSSVQELISQKNALRRRNPFLASGQIKMDFEVEGLLRDQGLGAESVPQTGQVVSLRRIANASAGGDVRDVTLEIPEPIKQAAVAALAPFADLLVAGVDVLYDPLKPAVRGNYAVIEINPRPHVGVNMYPTSGVGRDAPRAMIDLLFPGTRTVEDRGAQGIRFNENAIKNALRGGTVSSVALTPASPRDCAYRLWTTYSGLGAEESGQRIPVRTLQRIAIEMRVSGSFQLGEGGAGRLYAAAADSEVANEFVARVSKLLNAAPAASRKWSGPVTAGFTVAQPA